MDVFGEVVRNHRAYFRDAVVHAGHALGLFAALKEPRDATQLATHLGLSRPRLLALLDVLVLDGVLVRAGHERFALRHTPDPPPPMAAQGWGLLAEVLRQDAPLPPPDADAEGRVRYHRHLAQVARGPAQALMAALPHAPGSRLLDLGCGTGTYAATWLALDPSLRATLVDDAAILQLARAELGVLDKRIRWQPGDAAGLRVRQDHDVALLCNLLHLHDDSTCQRILARAARALRPGGTLCVKDLDIAVDRSGPEAALLFSLNMALYTRGGSLRDATTIAKWLDAAGFGPVRRLQLETTPESLVLVAERSDQAA